MNEQTRESKGYEDDESIPREPVSREQLGELKKRSLFLGLMRVMIAPTIRWKNAPLQQLACMGGTRERDSMNEVSK